MGTLRDVIGGRSIHLECASIVGRSERASLRIDDPRVSNEHASLRWDGAAWVLRDLGSLNSTFVNEQAVSAGESRPLSQGDRIAFGSEELSWTLDDAAPPLVMVVPLAGGPALMEQGGLLALPSTDCPFVTLFRGATGRWEMDAPSQASTPLHDQSIIEVQGQRYRVCIPNPVARTAPVRGFEGSRVADLTLVFRHRKKPSEVELALIRGSHQKSLGTRVHNELLFVLAQARCEDISRGLPEPNCGWLHIDAVCTRICAEDLHVNTMVFRARQQLAEEGIFDPACLIERRPRSRMLRLGAIKVSGIAATETS